jgi:predicted GIY-YIG superfamily endonuclease
MYVYLLESTSKKTYIGSTVNLKRRLRQHNKELVGGAKYTSKWVSKGDVWTRICYVSGFPTWIDALQFEWKWKKISRSIKSTSSLQKRMEALNILLSMEKSTYHSTPFDQWPTPPEVHEN